MEFVRFSPPNLYSTIKYGRGSMVYDKLFEFLVKKFLFILMILRLHLDMELLSYFETCY